MFLRAKGQGCKASQNSDIMCNIAHWFIQFTAFVPGLRHPILFVAVHPSWSSAAFFTSEYFALHSPFSVSCNKTSFLNTCPKYLCFHCQIVFNMHLVYFFKYRNIISVLQFQFTNNLVLVTHQRKTAWKYQILNIASITITS